MKKNSYRNYVIIMMVLLAIIPIILLTGTFLLPCQYDDTFLGELKYKYEKLEKTSGKRIVLVGGSSVAFGTDSAILEQQFPDYSVINFGMYAALGTTAMLDLSEDNIKEGDIVILSPEQDEQTLSDYFNAEMMWQAVDGAFYLLPKLNGEYLGEMIGELPYFAVQKWKYCAGGVKPEAQGVYSRSSFNAYGDMESAACQKNIMRDGYDTNQIIDFSVNDYDDAFIARVNQYIDDLTSKGAVVWYRFPPMNAWAVENEEDLDSYYDELSQKLHCEIIGNPHESVLEPEWFYDTNFHLNQSGKIRNTYQLTKDIKAMLGNSTATNIVVPTAPEFAAEKDFEGNDVDAEYFNYEMIDGKQWIIGITEAGKQKVKLIIPSNNNGFLIYGVKASAFKDNTKVEQITVQKNLIRLEDNMFEGCNNLVKIIMDGVEPEECQVGQNLLHGTQAKIYVEPELVSDYKTNYSWSQYGNAIMSQN